MKSSKEKKVKNKSKKIAGEKSKVINLYDSTYYIHEYNNNKRNKFICSNLKKRVK